MNFYVNVINNAIDYIEDNINEKLSLAVVSCHFGISDFHFNRMFKIVSGISMKQYIVSRKLAKAIELLRGTNQSIIDISFELGFEYPEVFSRAFKKQFGVSPAKFRDSSLVLDAMPRASIIERSIINHKGTLALKGNSVFIQSFLLSGISVETNTNNKNFEQKLRTETELFLSQSSEVEALCRDSFYTVVNCHGMESGEYTIFCGRIPMESASGGNFKERAIPGGWYAEFQYKGDMFEIREFFVDDIYRWLMVKEAELDSNGIGMINIYNNDYPTNDGVRILVPLKKPV